MEGNYWNWILIGQEPMEISSTSANTRLAAHCVYPNRFAALPIWERYMKYTFPFRAAGVGLAIFYNEQI